MNVPILSMRIAAERDIVVARQRVRSIAQLLGFDRQDCVRIATAVSEVARNAFGYANGGKIDTALSGKTAPQVFMITVSDSGPGIAHLDEVLAGSYRSPTGMGLGLVGARRLMDGFDIASGPTGTTVVLKKFLPARSPLLGPREIANLTEQLARERSTDPWEELQRQNQELLGALEELRRRQTELLELNRELEDTNRGVVALYAELDDRALHLQRADELKRRFLSNMSHEFRTPLHSVIALARLLSDHVDGPLTSEQEKQVGYIDQAARGLLDLVNDLLDLAKVEAGRTDVRPTEFAVVDTFSALRGMLRPLLNNERLRLVFEDPADAPVLYTDEGKLSQILRNLISNALKFTDSGEVRVSCTVVETPRETPRAVFCVTDTGIGIATGDLPRIFEEFGQLDSPVQHRVKGTGLGLPLSRQLARLLGGSLEVESTLGVGSTFTLTIPAHFAMPSGIAADDPWSPQPGMVPVLVIDDDPVDRFLVEKHLRNSRYQMMSASSLREARQWLERAEPQAYVLDVALRGEDTWGLLAELKSNPATLRRPVVLVTQTDDEPKARSLGADAYFSKPLDPTLLVRELDRLTGAVERAPSAG